MKRLAWLLVFLASSQAGADERILDFHSAILVQSDGGVAVTETIRVRAEGREIRRGIYRDFPTEYRDRFGNDVHVRFEPLAVMRNDRIEDFHVEKRSNGVRVYFGDANRLLDPGIHNYTFRYTADRMLGYFEDHDELYWNVTGLGWAFPIDKVSATINLPFDVTPADLELHGYTGRYGAAGSSYRSSISSTGEAHFETTRPLAAGEGLTIAVGWPKGFVAAPTAPQQFGWVLADNANLLLALAGLLAMFAYYVPAWKAFGKDPEPGVVVTRYEPPEGFSPASLRYVEKMHYDNTAMTAAVLSLAVKGYLRISEDDDGHSLTRLTPQGTPPLATGERELLDALFEEGDTLELDDEYHKRIGGARKAHGKSLQRDYRNRYFRTNSLMNLPAAAIGVTSGVIALNVGSGPSPAVIATIIAMVIVLGVFAWLMRQPTARGRHLLDAVEGFREYLNIAEKDEMNLRNPPEKTPALFEGYLPFALALGVEQAWAERFSSVFARISADGGSAYSPLWYSGSWNNFDIASTTTGLASGLDTAISSSASPPGSSSGSGGGGFSGGGGGGGGGGGW